MELIYTWVYQPDFETNSATPGKIFEHFPLYTCPDTKEGLEIITLNQEARSNRTAGASHLTVNVDADFPVSRTQDIFEDAHGFTYRSVRFCDLDRICDK